MHRLTMFARVQMTGWYRRLMARNGDESGAMWASVNCNVTSHAVAAAVARARASQGQWHIEQLPWSRLAATGPLTVTLLEPLPTLTPALVHQHLANVTPSLAMLSSTVLTATWKLPFATVVGHLHLVVVPLPVKHSTTQHITCWVWLVVRCTAQCSSPLTALPCVCLCWLAASLDQGLGV